MAIKNNPTANKTQLAKLCNLGTTRISEITAKLKEIGKIERAGSKRNGYWIVL